MFVENIKSDFYGLISSEHVAVLVHYDIDAICAYRILQALFRYDNISYSLIPIYGLNDLRTAYQENSSLFRHFILINCGGCIDLIDQLDPVDERSVFFVIDSHRPLDVCNVYNNGQIRIVCSPADIEDIPKFADIFADDEIDQTADDVDEGDDNEDNNLETAETVGDADDAESGSENENESGYGISEKKLLQKRDKRLWRQKRDKILMEYTQFSCHSKASSIFFYELAWKLSKDSKDLLWLAIVALTEQYILKKIENSQYVLEITNLQSHVTRLTNRTNNISLHAKHISFENDLKLALFRHWTVESSLKYSQVTACKLKMWSQTGMSRLKDLLVEIGIPLVQSRQNFLSMELMLRQEFQKSIESVSKKFQIENIEFSSFILQTGYKSRYSASDYVLASIALLETSLDSNLETGFQETVDCLQNVSLIEEGVEKAKVLLISVFQQVQIAISMRLIKIAGPFIYYVVSEELHEWHLFRHPHSLSLLAQFLLQAYCSVSRNRKAPAYPLIVCSPIDKDNSLLLGIPPLLENSPRNFFGKAFEQVSEKNNCEIEADFFDSTFIRLKTKDRSKFLDALTSILV